MKKTILVTGGAGYIGSHTAYLLAAHGYSVVILDSFVYNQPFAPNWATVIRGDVGDAELVRSIVREHKIHAVMHFAAHIEVGRSATHPHEFYLNNMVNTATFLEVLRTEGIEYFIFSSTCAVYGNPIAVPINESHPRNPINPYGKTKLAIERMLEDYAAAYPLKYVALRYFNAAGALPEAGLGEMHEPETHLIPRAIQAILREQPFTIFGVDYSTPDGTAVRDYVHVMDIARAHMQALAHLEKTGISDVFNLGTGYGYSVRQVISAIETITGRKMLVQECPRRGGDAEVLVADPQYAHHVLGWEPTQSSLDFIMQSALKWEQIRVVHELEKKPILLVA